MASLPTKSFSQIVSTVATAVQGTATVLLDFAVGSVLRAVAEAAAGVVLWLQAMILQVLTLTRASTSVGPDLDSWMADFSFARLPAVSAAGVVTFSRFTTTQQALIPAGATVATADGSQTYAVQAVTTNPAWSAALSGYVLAADTSGISLPVTALTAGTGGNAQIGAVSVLTTPIPGVDTVTNAAAFTTGVDAESDAAFRTRFVLYLASLSKATKTAIGAAITSLQQGMQYAILENQLYDGTYAPGYFCVVVDDGTGTPPSNLLTSAANAVEAVRAVGTRYGVFAPVVVTANVSMTVSNAAGYTHGTVVGQVAAALSAFINSLPLGTTLRYTQLAAVAYSVPGVTNVTSVLLNSTTADLAATLKQTVKAGTLTIA